MAVVSLLFILFAISYTSKSKTFFDTWITWPLTVIAFAAFTRVVIIILIGQNTLQVSNYNIAFYGSKLLPNLSANHRIFSGWTLVLYYFRLIPTELKGICLNSILTAVSAVLLYYITILANFKKETAILGALLFLFWPAHAFYTIILSPEHLFIFFMLLSFLFVLIAKKKIKRTSSILFYCIAGMTLSIANFFKSISIIFIFSFIILHIINTLSKKQSQDKSRATSVISMLNGGGHNKIIDFQTLREIFLSEHMMIVYMLITFIITINLIFMAMESHTKVSINRNPLPHFVYMGLTHGYWTPETNIYENIVIQKKFDYNAASKEMYRLLSEYIRQHQNLTFRYFINKLRITWADNNYMGFVTATMDRNNLSVFNVNNWEGVLYPFIHYYYLFIMFFFMVSTVVSFFKHERGIIPFIFIAIFGFSILLLITESQPRYKCLFYPLISLCSAYAMNWTCMRIKELLYQICHTGKNKLDY
jgi:hypothetical protein